MSHGHQRSSFYLSCGREQDLQISPNRHVFDAKLLQRMFDLDMAIWRDACSNVSMCLVPHTRTTSLKKKKKKKVVWYSLLLLVYDHCKKIRERGSRRE